MLKLHRLLLAVIGMCSLGSISSADIIFFVDFDAVTSGVQSSAAYNVGDTVTANIFANLTADTDSMVAYNFNVDYTSSLLTFSTRSETPGNLGGGFVDGSQVLDAANGVVHQIDGISTGAGVVGTFSSPVQIAKITFIAAGPGVGTIVPNSNETLFNSVLDTNGNDVTAGVKFLGGTATISAVPEPTSMALVAIAISAAAMGRRFSKRKKTRC